MTTIRPMDMFDLLKFGNVNLDLLTETFFTSFYGTYFNKWAEYSRVQEDSVGSIQGYLLGKVEGEDAKREWHGHVSAVTVAPQFRR
jgi:N-terminal acetyltransferase B complex catalytic subunit